MSRCPNCSGENAETQRFCGECGTPLPRGSRLPAETGVGPTVSYGQAPEDHPPAPPGFQPGQVFANRYLIIEELGAGGMGRVYRALDRKLGEEIALKLIRPDVAADARILERFSAELRLARQVVHKNVARMFDLNEEGREPYITMEYVRGENLRRLIRKVGRLDEAQAVPIACQLCEGLAEAHRLGIVHRDLKPQNVMIDEDGQAKIMDFGLAGLLGPAGGPDRVSGGGTPAYVSPEQVRGFPADERSDLYALGVVMYEMVTGRTPFRAKDVKALLEMQLEEAPRDPRELNPAVSAELGRVILRCLEKDPALRFRSAAELRDGLAALAAPRHRWPSVWRIAAAAGALAVVAAAAALALGLPERWRPSLAVLPVEDVGLTEANPVVLAGLQREVADRLAEVPGLRVLPPVSVNAFDLGGKSTPQIGKILGVRHLLKLTVAMTAEAVDAKIYLYDARKDVLPRPMNYQKALTDYRALQDEIALMTARALGVELSREQLLKFSRRGTDDIEAYTLFLEAMTLLEKGTVPEDVSRVVGLLTRAVEIDPDYALGHWGLGYAYENLYNNRGADKDPAALEEMFEHLNRASRLDPTFAETNSGLGWYHFYKGDNARAFDCFRRALELEPGNAIVNRDAGAFLMSVGLYGPAVRHLSRAAELAPRSSLPLTQVAQCLYFLGRCEKALRYSGKAVAVQPDDGQANALHAVLLVLTGRLDEAERQIRAMERLDLPDGRFVFLEELIAALRVAPGRPREFRTEKPRISPQGTYIYLLFGMKDEALANIRAGIERGFAENSMYFYSYPSLAKNPWYRDLRSDPRFREILKSRKELYDRELKAFERF